MAIDIIAYLNLHPWIVPLVIALVLGYVVFKFGKNAFQIIFYVIGIIAGLKYLGWLPF